MNKLQKIVAILTIVFGVSLQSVFASEDLDKKETIFDLCSHKYPDYIFDVISVHDQKFYFGTLREELTRGSATKDVPKVIRIHYDTSNEDIKYTPIQGLPCLEGAYCPSINRLKLLIDFDAPGVFHNTKYAQFILVHNNRCLYDDTLYILDIETMKCANLPEKYLNLKTEEGYKLVPYRIKQDSDNQVNRLEFYKKVVMSDGGLFADFNTEESLFIDLKDLLTCLKREKFAQEGSLKVDAATQT